MYRYLQSCFSYRSFHPLLSTEFQKYKRNKQLRLNCVLKRFQKSKHKKNKTLVQIRLLPSCTKTQQKLSNPGKPCKCLLMNPYIICAALTCIIWQSSNTILEINIYNGIFTLFTHFMFSYNSSPEKKIIPICPTKQALGKYN